VADTTGAGRTQFRHDAGDEIRLRDTAFGGGLWRDAGNQCGFGVAEGICAGLAIQLQRFTDDVEFGIRADTGKLGRTVTAWIGAKGFVVVPVQRGATHPSRASACSIHSASTRSSCLRKRPRSCARRALSVGLPSMLGLASLVY